MTACAWPIAEECLPELSDSSGSDYQNAVVAREAAKDMAVSVLWALSGRQFGICPYIVRPCTETIGGRWPYTYANDWWVAWWDGAHWQTWACGCAGRCRTSGPSAVHLPGPAQDVIEVVIEGQPLSPAAYVLEGDVLHRRNQVAWPAQDLSRPMGETNTWSVEYLRGNPVPPGVDRFTGLLAKEFLAACSGQPCRLPRSVTTVNRAGVVYNLFNPNQIYDSGKTGIPEIDMWLAAVNPHHLQCAPTVL